MDGFVKVSWAPPEGTLAADHQPPLHFWLCCQLLVYTPQNLGHLLSTVSCQPPQPGPAQQPWRASPPHPLHFTEMLTAQALPV